MMTNAEWLQRYLPLAVLVGLALGMVWDQVTQDPPVGTSRPTAGIVDVEPTFDVPIPACSIQMTRDEWEGLNAAVLSLRMLVGPDEYVMPVTPERVRIVYPTFTATIDMATDTMTLREVR